MGLDPFLDELLTTKRPIPFQWSWGHRAWKISSSLFVYHYQVMHWLQSRKKKKKERKENPRVVKNSVSIGQFLVSTTSALQIIRRWNQSSMFIWWCLLCRSSDYLISWPLLAWKPKELWKSPCYIPRDHVKLWGLLQRHLSTGRGPLSCSYWS